MSTAVLADPLSDLGNGIVSLFEGEIRYTPPGASNQVETTAVGFLLAWGTVFIVFFSLISWSELEKMVPFIHDATKRVKMAMALFLSLSVVYFSPFSEWFAGLINTFVWVIYFGILILIFLFAYVVLSFAKAGTSRVTVTTKKSLNEDAKETQVVEHEVKQRHAANLAHEATIAAQIKQAETDLFNANGTLPGSVADEFTSRLKVAEKIMSGYNKHHNTVHDFLEVLGNLLATVPEHELLPYVNSTEGRALMQFIQHHLRDDLARDLQGQNNNAGNIRQLTDIEQDINNWQTNYRGVFYDEQKNRIDELDNYVQMVRHDLYNEITSFDRLLVVLYSQKPANLAAQVATEFRRFMDLVSHVRDLTNQANRNYGEVTAAQSATDTAFDDVSRFLQRDPSHQTLVENIDVRGNDIFMYHSNRSVNPKPRVYRGLGASILIDFLHELQSGGTNSLKIGDYVHHGKYTSEFFRKF